VDSAPGAGTGTKEEAIIDYLYSIIRKGRFQKNIDAAEYVIGMLIDILIYAGYILKSSRIDGGKAILEMRPVSNDMK
jgi:hypothetical protein